MPPTAPDTGSRPPPSQWRPGRARRSGLARFALAGSFALGALIGAAPATAQNGGVRGRVVDETGEPISGAAITLEFLGGVSRSRSLTSDENGSFVGLGIRLGEYRMEIRKNGWLPHAEDVRIRAGPPERLGERTLRRAPGTSPTPPPAADGDLVAGRTAMDSDDPETAAAAFEAAVRADPESADARLALGLAYRALERPEAALEALREAVALRPDSYEALVAVADVAASTGGFEETVTSLEQALAIRPDSEDALYNLAGAQLNLGRMDEAAAALDRLLAENPEHPGATYRLAMVALNQGRLDDAARLLERVIELAPESADAEAARGMLAALRPLKPGGSRAASRRSGSGR